jgi:hypothetical protein
MIYNKLYKFRCEQAYKKKLSCTAERTGAGVMHAVRRNARQAPHPVAKLGKRFAVAIFMHLRLLVLRPAI